MTVLGSCMLICNIVMVARSLGLDFGVRLITLTMAVSRACMVAALGPCLLHHVVVPFVLLFLLFYLVTSFLQPYVLAHFISVSVRLPCAQCFGLGTPPKCRGI